VARGIRTPQVWPNDIAKICGRMQCSRSQLAERLGVSKASVSRWEKRIRSPRGKDADRLRELLGEQAAPVLDVMALRLSLKLTQRDFGKHFNVSRQQVAKWEQGAVEPRAQHFETMVKLATTVASMEDRPTPVRNADLLTVIAAATYLHVAEKTIRNAIKDGRLVYVRDTMPGPWPKNGRYLMARTDLDAFKTGGYDPCFKKGRRVRGHRELESAPAVLAFRVPDLQDPPRHQT
jgi:DNA-binding transcriptional regulator YiaG